MSVLVQAPTKVVKVAPGTKAVKVAATGPQGVGVQSSMTAKGDMLVGQGPVQAGVLGVGPNGTVPVADSTQPLGIRWDTIPIDLGFTPANDALVVHLAGTEVVTGAKTFSTATAFNAGLTVGANGILSQAGYLGLFGVQGTFVQGGDANHAALIVRGVTSQSASLQEWQSSSGSALAHVDSGGSFYGFGGFFGSNAAFLNSIAYVGISGPVASGIQLAIRGAPSQSADLQQWQDNSGAVVAAMASYGALNATNGFSSPAGTGYSYAGAWLTYSTGGSWFLRDQVNGTMALQGSPGTLPTVSVFGLLTVGSPGIQSTGQISAGTSGPYNGSFNFWAVGSGNNAGISFANTTAVTGRTFTIASLNEGALNFAESGYADGRLYIAAGGAISSGYGAASGGAKFAIQNDMSASTVVAVIRGAPSQSGDLQQWLNNAGTSLVSVKSGGNVWIQGGTLFVDTVIGYNNGVVTFQSASAAVTPIVSKGTAGQTGDLQQWQDSAGAMLASIGTDGRFTNNSYVIVPYLQATTELDASVINTYAGSQMDFRITGITHFLLRPDQIGLNVPVRSVGQNPALTALIVQGEVGQTADMQQWQSSTGVVLASVTAGGNIITQGSGYIWGGNGLYAGSQVMGAYYLGIQTGATNVAAAFRGAVGQSADLTQWQDSGGNNLMRVGPTGTLWLGRPGVLHGIIDSADGMYFNVNANAGIGGGYQFLWQTGTSGGGGTQLMILNAMVGSGPVGGLGLNTSAITTLPAMFTIVPVTSSTVGEVIRGAPSQSADLQEWQRADGSIHSVISWAGSFFHDSTQSGNGGLFIQNGPLSSPNITPSSVGAYVEPPFSTAMALVLRGQASQSADLQQWQNNSGGVLAEMTPGGNLNVSGLVTAGGGTTQGFGFTGNPATGGGMFLAGTTLAIRSTIANAPIYLQDGVGTTMLTVGTSVSMPGGLGVWGHAAPGAQPARPVTLADVINLIVAYGLSA